MVFLVVGLGNPGPRYSHNRHNIGFVIVDALAQAFGRSSPRSKFSANIVEADIQGERALLMQPQTFMNESGISVGEAMRFMKLPLQNLIVIHDELDLPRGKLRIKTGGGDNGHNGLKSISAHCGADYKRYRVGIGRPVTSDQVHHYVLQDFRKDDAPWIDAMAQSVVKNFGLALKGQDSELMNRISGAVKDKLPVETGDA